MPNEVTIIDVASPQTPPPSSPPPQPSQPSKALWAVKFAACVLYDAFDMTVGRLMFATPFLGEAIGVGLTCIMFGKAGMLYGLEALDFTEQIDGFVPAASIIAWCNRPAAL